MGVETAGVPQEAKTVVVSKPKEDQPERESAALEDAKKKWGAVDLPDANAKSEAYVKPILTEVRKELSDIAKTTATFTGSGYQEGNKPDNVVAFTGAGYEEQMEEKRLVGSDYDKEKAKSSQNEKPVDQMSDADILIKENGYLGVREAYVNLVFSWTPKDMIPPNETQFVGHPDGKIKAAWRLVQSVVNPRSWIRDQKMEDIEDSPSGGKRVIDRTRNGEKPVIPIRPVLTEPLAKAA